MVRRFVFPVLGTYLDSVLSAPFETFTHKRFWTFVYYWGSPHLGREKVGTGLIILLGGMVEWSGGQN